MWMWYLEQKVFNHQVLVSNQEPWQWPRMIVGGISRILLTNKKENIPHLILGFLFGNPYLLKRAQSLVYLHS